MSVSVRGISGSAPCFGEEAKQGEGEKAKTRQEGKEVGGKSLLNYLEEGANWVKNSLSKHPATEETQNSTAPSRNESTYTPPCDNRNRRVGP